ncbi:hypothetical protein LJC01_01875 [Clostridiaceae bacterium OttesenSCG-928-D20]|nr:hypothetical protein [Clostridiaceae bacterium OttesenSCG-928-D20]
MDKTLNMISLCKKAGSVQIGEENSAAAIRAGKAKVLFLASDSSDNAKRRAEGFIFGTNVLISTLPYTKLEISNAVGKTGCSMLAVTDIGFAVNIARGIGSEPLYNELKLKEEKTKKRRLEMKAHVRNVRQGKGRSKHE